MDEFVNEARFGDWDDKDMKRNDVKVDNADFYRNIVKYTKTMNTFCKKNAAQKIDKSDYKLKEVLDDILKYVIGRGDMYLNILIEEKSKDIGFRSKGDEIFTRMAENIYKIFGNDYAVNRRVGQFHKNIINKFIKHIPNGDWYSTMSPEQVMNRFDTYIDFVAKTYKVFGTENTTIYK